MSLSNRVCSRINVEPGAIPEGWKPVRFGVPTRKESFLSRKNPKVVLNPSGKGKQKMEWPTSARIIVAKIVED